MRKKWKKPVSLLLCLFLTCTNLTVGEVSQVHAEGRTDAAPYEGVYVIDDAHTADTEYEGKEFCQIAFSEGWTLEEGGGGQGCYNDTDHWTDTDGATCTISFVGTNLKFYSRTGKGFGAADFSVDGKEAVNVDFASNTQQNNMFLYDTGLLGFGEHVLTIEAKGLIVVDRVEVSCPYAFVNDADEGTGAMKVNYPTGTWQHQSSEQEAPEGCTHHAVQAKEAAFQKDAHWAMDTGTLEMQFYGTSVKYYTESQNGQVNVYIDDMDTPAASGISMQTGTPNQGLAFDSSEFKTLDAGLHTMKVEITSGIVVSDRFEVCCSHKNEGTALKNEKEATCTEAGYSGDTHYQYCGQKAAEGEATKALGHDWDEGVVTKEPTETEDGEKTYTCTRAGCGQTRKEMISVGCSHENKQERNLDATCEEAGYRDAFYCPDCDKMISEGTPIAALGHDPEVRGAKEASGTEDGYTGDTYCKREGCGKLLAEGEVISKAVAVVNNAVTGTEDWQFDFSEGWTYEKADSSVGCYEDDNHWSATEGATLAFKFTGTSVRYYGQKASNLGYAAFSIDDGEEEEISMYQARKEDQALIYKSQDLEPGTHTLKVRVTGKKGEGGHAVVVADRIEAYCSHKGEETESRDEAATCTEPGYTGSAFGKLCGQKVSDGVKSGDALGHTEEIRESKAPTCTEPGHTEQKYCTRCEQITEQGEEIPALGHKEKVREAVAATCTQAGSTGEVYCETCEQILSPGEAIPALGHAEETRDLAATCTEPGYAGQKYCTRCNEILSQGEETAALGHQWDAGVVTKQPTADEPGVKTFTCTREGCGKTRTLDLPATGSGEGCIHEHTEIKDLAATCTENGYAGAVYCNDCQKVIAEGEAIPALGHNPEVRDAKEASGTEDGYTGDTYCKRCGELLEKGEAILKAYAMVNNAVTGNGDLEFEFSEGWTYEKADSSVGCYEDDNHWSDTEGATLTFKFNGTSAKYYGQKASNLGYAAFSVDGGEEEFVDLYSAEKENQALIYKTGDLQPGQHTLKVRVTGQNGEGGGHVVVADRIEAYCSHKGEEMASRDVPATCTEPGYTGEMYGKVCGQKISEGQAISALGHKETLRGEKPATCVEAGHTGEKYCAACNAILDPGKEIPALGHQWDEGVITKQPTATKTGIKTYTCAVCKETRTETVAKLPSPSPKPPKKGSILKDASSKAEYKVLSAKVSKGKVTGTVAYQKPAKASAKTVTVPAKITVGGGTYTVVSIADKAFRNNKKITKVTVGSSVKTIGANAFYGCGKLRTVTFGKNVTTIGAKAFGKCVALTKLTLPAKVAKIGNQAFYGCKKLKTVTVKTTKLKKSSVGANAFKGIHANAVIKVPKSRLKAYKSIFKARGAGKKVKIKK